jgi:hypothetical protein
MELETIGTLEIQRLQLLQGYRVEILQKAILMVFLSFEFFYLEIPGINRHDVDFHCNLKTLNSWT